MEHACMAGLINSRHACVSKRYVIVMSIYDVDIIKHNYAKHTGGKPDRACCIALAHLRLESM